MNKVNKVNSFVAGLLIIGATLFSGCGDKDNDGIDNLKEFKIQNRDALNQTMYADEVGGKSLTFTSSGAWTSNIVETTQKSSSTVPWLSISPSSGSEAGEYTVTVNVAPNATAAERKATITITCNGEDITISVTQRATTVAGGVYKPEITMTTDNTTVSVWLTGTGLATVHWGYSTLDAVADETRMLSPYDSTKFSQNFARNEHRTITITGDNITGLYCDDDKLSALDVSKNVGLTHLYCVYSRGLTFLDLSRNAALKLLWVVGGIRTLDLSGLKDLRDLYVQGTQLTSLDLSGLTALTNLICYNNYQLTSLDLSGSTALTNLRVYYDYYDYGYNSQLTSLDVSGCTALTTLYISSGQLTSLDLSSLTALTSLGVRNNLLTALDLSGLTALTSLDVYNNLLTDVSMNDLFGTLHGNTGFSKRIYIGSNPGTSTCDRSIATAKGWSVSN